MNMDWTQYQVRFLNKNEGMSRLNPHLYTHLNLKNNNPVYTVPPEAFLTPKRFDILAKSLLSNCYLTGNGKNWGEELYLQHIFAFNRGKEPDGMKNHLKDFLISFRSIHDSLYNDGFNPDLTVLPVTNDGVILDGAHRLGVCLTLKLPVSVMPVDHKGWGDYDHNYFMRKGLNVGSLDAMALEAVRLLPDIKIVMLFPSAGEHIPQSLSLLASAGAIFYTKEIELNQRGAHLLMSQVYSGEKWVGSISNRFPGAAKKAELCFDGSVPMVAVLFLPNQGANLVNLKKQIRTLCHKENHSIHINDTSAETLQLARILYNENSIEYLNRSSWGECANFNNLLSQYKQATKFREDMDHFCLAGSVPMAAYGIRDCKDLDYITPANQEIFGNKYVSSHSSQAQYYTHSFDEIVFNPKLHFYYDNVKIAALDVCKSMKAKRNEDKDKKDVALISEFFAGAPSYPFSVLTNTIKTDATIGFVNNWKESESSILKRYKQYTPNGTGEWLGLKAIANPEKADYLVVMDGMPNDSSSKLLEHPKKIFFQREPPEIKPITHEPDDCIFFGSYQNHYHVATWLVKLPFSELLKLEPPKRSKGPLSAVISGKTKTDGQRQRLDALRAIQKQYPSINIYGRGLEGMGLDFSYKGSLEGVLGKFNGLFGYDYSLAFENSSHRNYFTEKIIDCFLCWSKPVYWGCTNISDFFPEESYDYVDLNSETNIDAVLDCLTRPVDLDAISETRKKVLEEYSLWPSILKIIQKED